MNSFITVLKKYAVFSGRARRREYWMFILFYFIFIFLAIALDNLLGLTIAGEEFGPIYAIYFFATILPNLAVQIRRLHDIGKSGWYLLLNLIPLIGGIWILVLFCTEGTPGLNYYGPNPKENTNSMNKN